MKKNAKFITYLSLQVVVLFSIAMAMTYFSDMLAQSGFFGDKACPYYKVFSDGSVRYYCGASGVDSTSWGARHYWYNWMCFILFFLSLIRICAWSFNYWNDEKN